MMLTTVMTRPKMAAMFPESELMASEMLPGSNFR